MKPRYKKTRNLFLFLINTILLYPSLIPFFCLAGKLILYFQHSFTLLSQPLQTDRQTEKGIHLLRVGWRNLTTLRVGWRNFFSSCAVVSVFGSGGKQVLVLHTSYVLRVSYHTVVVLCQFFGSGRKQFLVLRTYLVICISFSYN